MAPAAAQWAIMYLTTSGEAQLNLSLNGHLAAGTGYHTDDGT